MRWYRLASEVRRELLLGSLHVWDKPYCVLLLGRGKADTVRKQIARCTFYGVWPSFGSLYSGEDSELENNYPWNIPAIEQDRPIWKKYIPALKLITRAGSQPVTCATSDNPDAWIERYGKASDPAVYFTLFNPTSSGSLSTSPWTARDWAFVDPCGSTLSRSQFRPEPRKANSFIVCVPAEDTVVMALCRLGPSRLRHGTRPRSLLLGRSRGSGIPL